MVSALQTHPTSCQHKESEFSVQEEIKSFTCNINH